MKFIPTVTGVLITALSLAFFFGQANSDTAQPAASNTPHPVSVEKNHPLAMAHEQLKKAYEDYNKGDLAAVQKELNIASQWLQNSNISQDTKTRDEAARLNSDIQQLQQKISRPGTQKKPEEEHESAISRIWHRSTALVEREIQQAAKGWAETTAANKTLKYLVDARLHFHYAEHDLFISRNREKANSELQQTLLYLDRASKVANPEAQQKIMALRAEIQSLASTAKPDPEQVRIINALNTAQTAIQDSSQGAPAEIRNRLTRIATDISQLKQDIGSLENKQHYEAIMQKLQALDTAL